MPPSSPTSSQPCSNVQVAFASHVQLFNASYHPPNGTDPFHEDPAGSLPRGKGKLPASLGRLSATATPATTYFSYRHLHDARGNIGNGWNQQRGLLEETSTSLAHHRPQRRPLILGQQLKQKPQSWNQRLGGTSTYSPAATRANRLLDMQDTQGQMRRRSPDLRPMHSLGPYLRLQSPAILSR